MTAPSPNGTQWDAQCLAGSTRPPRGLVHTRGCGTGTSYGGDDAQWEPKEILKLSPCAECPEKDKGIKNHAAAHISNRQTCRLAAWARVGLCFA